MHGALLKVVADRRKRRVDSSPLASGKDGQAGGPQQRVGEKRTGRAQDNDVGFLRSNKCFFTEIHIQERRRDRSVCRPSSGDHAQSQACVQPERGDSVLIEREQTFADWERFGNSLDSEPLSDAQL
jgi:hypothetical protein